MRVLYLDFVCTTEWSVKNFHKVIEKVLKEIRGIEVDNLLKAMFPNNMLLEGRMVAQIQMAYDLKKKKSYPYLTYDIKKNDGLCPCCGSRKSYL